MLISYLTRFHLVVFQSVINMKLEKVFKLFDMSNNGTISKQEILEILRFMLGDHIDTQNLRTGSREYFFRKIKLSYLLQPIKVQLLIG